MSKSKANFSVRMDQKIVDDLRTKSKNEHRSIAATIRLAIQEFLRRKK